MWSTRTKKFLINGHKASIHDLMTGLYCVLRRARLKKNYDKFPTREESDKEIAVLKKKHSSLTYMEGLGIIYLRRLGYKVEFIKK